MASSTSENPHHPASLMSEDFVVPMEKHLCRLPVTVFILSHCLHVLESSQRVFPVHVLLHAQVGLMAHLSQEEEGTYQD